ncbi:Tricarboxylate transport membrane protein TctA [Roseibacterium elongatum DSM 19469]|uniref:Tricarboxylate transport membrane protein TctA n=1 Tax=Roseicyclus elongatus DSM 19469 TaxID=1294273 RepID=W8S6N9_9RHOB|nr:Tricarboxylate transport membrane protein TctA [Roseibacterium elongatum DSM 19469]
MLFERQADLVWGLVASLYMANIALLILNLPMIGIFTRLMMTPTWALMPIVAAVTFVGVYGISNSVFDLEMMVFFGVIGYILRKMDVSLVPLVLGLLLGGDMERNLRRAMSISDGDWSILIASPISITLYVMTVFFLGLSVWLTMRDHKQAQSRTMEG